MLQKQSYLAFAVLFLDFSSKKRFYYFALCMFYNHKFDESLSLDRTFLYKQTALKYRQLGKLVIKLQPRIGKILLV